MKLLLTGFEPFDKEPINPSFEVVKKVKSFNKGFEIEKIEVPTVFGKSSENVIKYIEVLKPDAIIMVGQAGGRNGISIERIAININDASIPDNANKTPVDQPIILNGPAAYFSTLPIKNIVTSLNNSGIPASVSNTAGTYVCNHLFYSVMHYLAANKLFIPAGFIHIPYLPLQAVNKSNTPSMSMDILEKAFNIIIKIAHNAVINNK